MGRRYRQLFLFLAVLTLPSILIVVQGWWITTQDEELAAEHLEDLRKRTATEIGQEIVTSLEHLKAQEMANLPKPTSQSRYSDPAVVAVGWLDGDRPVWSWEISAVPSRGAKEEPEFELTLDAANRAFSEKRYDAAEDFYRQAVKATTDEARKGVANTRLAALLKQTGRSPAAVAAYNDLLNLPSRIRDRRSGLSFWSGAAVPLIELKAADNVLPRLLDELKSPAALPTIHLYRFRSILEALQKSSDEKVRAAASTELAAIEVRLKRQEQAEALQKDFPKLRVTTSVWQSYDGSEKWLVGRAPEGVTSPPLIIAVRWETIRERVEADRRSRNKVSGFETVPVGIGDPLSDDLLDLAVFFPPDVFSEAASLNPQRNLWGLSIGLVALFTLLGGYLLWRDVRRDAHLAELRTQFVSSVSHELKTPLTSIRMFAELLQMRETDKERSGFLDTIVSESERLTRLLSNVLDFSRIERGQKTYRLQPAPLAEVVHAAARTVQYPLSQQGFSLDLNVCEDVPQVSLDRDALQQAVLNLLTNAMKYSGESRHIGLRLCAESGNALIEVSDHGIGIPEQEQSRIFEKFYRARIPENLEISGTGLGLALVAHIVKAHGGSVDVKSRPGKGSTFSIRLPFHVSTAA